MEQEQPQAEPKTPAAALLIDGLCLLLAPEHPAMVVLALLQFAVRRSPFFSRGFLSLLGVRRVTPFWCIVFPGALAYLQQDKAVPDTAVTSSVTGVEEAETTPKHPENAAKLNSEKAETPQQNGEKRGETVSLAETEAKVAEALARLVISGDLQKTPAIQKGLQGKSGEAYQQKKAILDAAIARQQSGVAKYPRRTPEQEQRRADLGLIEDR